MNNLFIISENEIEALNVTKIIALNDKEIKLKIKETIYIITGENLEMIKISDGNDKLNISGKMYSIAIEKNKTKESIIKRIFKWLL